MSPPGAVASRPGTCCCWRRCGSSSRPSLLAATTLVVGGRAVAGEPGDNPCRAGTTPSCYARSMQCRSLTCCHYRPSASPRPRRRPRFGSPPGLGHRDVAGLDGQPLADLPDAGRRHRPLSRGRQTRRTSDGGGVASMDVLGAATTRLSAPAASRSPGPPPPPSPPPPSPSGLRSRSRSRRVWVAGSGVGGADVTARRATWRGGRRCRSGSSPRQYGPEACRRSRSSRTRCVSARTDRSTVASQRGRNPRWT